MERLLIVNGSPRAPKSNSKQYAQLVQKYWKGQADTYLVTSKKARGTRSAKIPAHPVCISTVCGRRSVCTVSLSKISGTGAPPRRYAGPCAYQLWLP